MANNEEKVWKVKNRNEMYSDKEVIAFIRTGKLKADDYLMSKDMKDWIRIGDSIYQFYIKEAKNENL